MRALLASFLLLVLCSTLSANEQTEKNAAEFLQGLTEVNTKICRTTCYRVLAGPALIGSASLMIEKSAFDSIPCYKLVWRVNLRLGDKSQTMEETDFVSAGMVSLRSIHTTRDESLDARTFTLSRADKKYVFVKTLKDGSLKSDVFDDCERLILTGAEDLVPLLLPLDKPATYDFNDHSGKWGYTGRTYEVLGAGESGSLKGTRIRHLYYNANDEKDKLDTSDVELLVNAEHGLVRMSRNQGKMMLELDTGENSIETIKAFARPVDPILGFCRALAAGDSDLMALAMNESRYLDEVWDRDEKGRNLTEKEREAIKKSMKGTLPKKMTSAKTMDERTKALFLAMGVDDFDLKFENSERAKIKFSEAYHKRTGDDSKLFWIVEFDIDSGKWRLVYLDSKDDEF